MDITDKVVRAWKTVREMLDDRGVDTAGSMDDAGITELASAQTTFGVPVNDQVTVVFHIGLQSIKKAEMETASEGATHVIVVLNTQASQGGKPNNATVKSLRQSTNDRGVKLEIFTLKEMQFNVTKHTLVPKHTKLDKEESVSLVDKLCLKSRFLLPIISQSDPVARYLGLNHGDIVSIDRPSLTNGAARAYRCCRKA